MNNDHETREPALPAVAPVTADDVELAVQVALEVLSRAVDVDWSVPAGELTWDCWETLEHTADSLWAYAAQVVSRRVPLDRYLALRWHQERPDGPANAVFGQREVGPAALLELLEAGGALLAATVRTTAPQVRAYHSYGIADPEGFAAMGVVETLVHTEDVARGLGLEWAPPGELCERALARLFPEVSREGAAADQGDQAGRADQVDQWTNLLWAAGRVELPGRPRRVFERWHSAPLAEGS
ncbi:hypothetical protein [Kitasatospora kifunensis]|uniref:Mycothiol-dependent maleylpyruvate isomerase metal-binding domain-containing protein n=1 Tax=Kitasatospora kifunensis TaxID=58351 RepID=A0A7W7R7T4_KITKI|nr:hypothetical protein [Kitasatospora kifunensis]MBB4926456.1 hypothetical protein [Kitasatospora kifunensis]